MSRRRWIADEFSADRAALTGAHAAHLGRTLRARVGQQFEVACGEQVHLATVNSVADDRVEFTLGPEIRSDNVVPIILLLAIFKFDRMEWAIEKCSELNVTMIVPVIARRTEKHLAVAAEKRVERWRRIAREASEQSRRTAPPQIVKPEKLRDALARDGATQHGDGIEDPTKSVILAESFSPSGGTGCPAERNLRIVLAETEREASLADVLRAHDHVQLLMLAIGPEGGWTEDELQRFGDAQWVAASLGETILRAETAAIAALAIARAELQQTGQHPRAMSV